MNEAQRQMALEQKIGQAGFDGEKLPALVREPSWLDKLIQKLVEFLGDRMPESDWNPDMDSVALIWELFKYLAMGLFCAAVFYLVYLVLRNLRGLRTSALLDHTGDTPTRTGIFNLLDDAIKCGDWARALRLRWQICLERRGAPPSTTISEAIREGWFIALDADTFVRGMFRPGEGSEALFRRFDQQLKRSVQGGES